MRAGVFLDRDGVLVRDVGLMHSIEQIQVLDGVPAALSRLCAAGFALVVVTNQAIVARGLVTMKELAILSAEISRQLSALGAPPFDGVYFCPHHPNATLAQYRRSCPCRKPSPGLLLRAAEELSIDLEASFMIGDRISDIIAGREAGCRCVLVETGRHVDLPIESSHLVPEHVPADYVCDGLPAAARWILDQ